MNFALKNVILLLCVIPVFSKAVNGRGKSPEAVKISLYHEFYCPYCMNFIEDQLEPAHRAIGEIMEIEMFAYGNAWDTKRTNSSGYRITCQHGQEECIGNAQLECGKKYIPDYDDYLNFAFCLDGQKDFDKYTLKCASNVGVNGRQILKCSHSEEGEEILHNVGLQQQSLDPEPNYVPWILVNDVHDYDLESRARMDLVGLICDLYEGELPRACKSKASSGVCRK